MKKTRAEKALPKNGPTKRVGSGRLVSPQKPTQSTWTWNPPLEEQLQAKVSALFDIAELADQIKDAECFRRHAKKIAKAHTATTASVSIKLG